MKKVTVSLKFFATALFGAIILFSCKKPDDVTPLTPDQLLKAKTWVYDELTEYETGFPPEVLYKKGAATNPLDLSKVEEKFLDNAVWQYTDPFGAANAGTWLLLDNNTKIQFTIPRTGPTETGLEVKITATTFSFKTVEATGYSIHKLIPKP
jgi:hypothetical protein